MPVYPEDTYLAKVGRLAWLVSDLEWLVLGDLSLHAHELPASIMVERLAGRTTGQIAERIGPVAEALPEGATREWLAAGARYLQAASELRNACLHARPATLDEGQRLVRWRMTGRDGVQSVEYAQITDAWLDETTQRIEADYRDLDRLRQLAKA